MSALYRLKPLLPFGAYAVAIAAVAFGVDRVPERVFSGGAWELGLLVAAMALAHWIWYRWTVARSFRQGLGALLFAAVLVRLPLFFSPPNLSDDFYRYLWDGRLVLEGASPFAHRPSELVGTPLDPDRLRAPGSEMLYGNFNSPEYYSLYPPTAQAAFAMAAACGGGEAGREAQVLRWLVLLAELASIVLLWQLLGGMRLPPERAAWYGLHPLAVVELTGNLHVEAFAVVFLLLALWLVQRGRWAWGALAWAGAIGAKLSPLWFLPLLWPLLGLRRWIFFGTLCGIACLISFAPLWCPECWANFSETTRLYYLQFAFNSPVELLARLTTEFFLGYSVASSLMPAVGLLAIAFPWYALLHRPGDDLRRTGELLCTGYTLYVLCSAMAHPWYLCLPLAFAPFCRPIFLWAWAALSVVSYQTYLWPDYIQSPWSVFLEYAGAVVIAWWAWRRSDRKF